MVSVCPVPITCPLYGTEVPGTCTGHRHHKHQGDIEGEDLEIGAVDKLLVGELGEHESGHQD